MHANLSRGERHAEGGCELRHGIAIGEGIFTRAHVMDDVGKHDLIRVGKREGEGRRIRAAGTRHQSSSLGVGNATAAGQRSPRRANLSDDRDAFAGNDDRRVRHGQIVSARLREPAEPGAALSLHIRGVERTEPKPQPMDADQA